MDIPHLNINEISSNCIKQAISDHHYQELKEQIAKCKKMQKNKEDDFREVQSYMKGKVSQNTRMAFRIRCEMVDEIRVNFSSKCRRLGGEEALTCQECK